MLGLMLEVRSRFIELRESSTRNAYRTHRSVSRIAAIAESTMLNVVLIEPEIPPNTGNIGRLCLATGAHLHLVKPLGFSLDDKMLLRAGLDYWSEVKVTLWDSFEQLLSSCADRARVFFLTTKSSRPYWDEQFRDGDFLVFGRETKGLPEPLLAANEGRCLTIPMPGSTRSLNLATAAGIVLYEAVRQLAAHPRG